MLTDLPLFFRAFLFLGASFLITYYIIPKIIWVAREKELVVKPDHRSSHKIITPSFGGVAFFICFILCYSILRSEFPLMHTPFVIPAVTLLFVIGLKDDLVVSTASAKLIGQLMSIAILFLNPTFYQISFHGFLGINELPAYMSVPFIFFFMVGFTNAYNLIDGIDGLAAFIGIVIFGAFGAIFYVVGLDFYFLVSLLLIGTLAAFIRFNFSKSVSRKIFMGDTGSLLIGFMIAFLALKVLAMEPAQVNVLGIRPANLPLIVGVILSIPIFDTCRIMVVRKLAKQRIFVPDRNHIHHILIDLGFTHFKTSLILSGINLGLIFSAYLFGMRFTWSVLLVFFVSTAILAYITFHYLKSQVQPFPIERKKFRSRMAFFQGLF